MALCLGVYVDDTIYIGNKIVSIIGVNREEKSISILADGEVFVLNSLSYVEVFPDIYFCVGQGKQTNHPMAKILIDAPRDIKILRGKLNDRNLY
jgi:sRNA-binding carbon storage regulator CsrA